MDQNESHYRHNEQIILKEMIVKKHSKAVLKRNLPKQLYLLFPLLLEQWGELLWKFLLDKPRDIFKISESLCENPLPLETKD